MLDIDLVEELDEASRKIPGVSRMSPMAAAAYVEGLAEAFVADASRLHWWEALKGTASRVRYGKADGLVKLEGLLAEHADVRLVVTDEEEPPWPVYAGTALQLLAMLRECRFCECVLAAPDMRWVVFDTHMNELVTLGLET